MEGGWGVGGLRGKSGYSPDSLMWFYWPPKPLSEQLYAGTHDYEPLSVLIP